VGVAHGFYFPDEATYLYGLSDEWIPAGDFGCRWDEERLGLDWSVDDDPMLSERDTDPLAYDEMVDRFEAAIAERRATRR